MKRLAITLVIICAVASVKAQQLLVRPKQQPLQKFGFRVDSLAVNNFTYKLMDSLGKTISTSSKQSIIANSNVDNMPVMRPQGNHNMPIAKTNPAAYNMPKARLGESDIVGVIEKRQPGNYNFNNQPDTTTKK